MYVPDNMIRTKFNADYNRKIIIDTNLADVVMKCYKRSDPYCGIWNITLIWNNYLQPTMHLLN